MITAWSLDGDTWIDLPVGPRFDLMLGQEEINLDLETDAGVEWIYRLFTRDRWELPFKITMDQLADFRALHDAVDGQLTPFYFTLDRTAEPIVYIYGRKEPGFLPQGTGEFVNPPLFNYRLIIRQEIAVITGG